MNFGSDSFLNSEKEIAVYDNTVSARTYLSYIAEQAGGFAFIGRDGKLYIRTIGEYTSEIPLKYFEDFKWGTEFKISRIKYEDGVQLLEAGDETNNTVYIGQENMYIIDQEQIDNIYNKLNGLEVYSFEGNSIIDPALDIGDLILVDGKYIIYQDSCQYSGKWKASISSKLISKEKEETMSRTPSTKKEIRRIQSQINQAEGVISSLVEVTTSLDNNMDILNADLQKQLEDLSINLQGYQATVSTQFEQTATDYTFLFNTLIENINTTAEGNSEKFAEISKYIRFEDGNIILGESNNELILKIQNDKISYQQNGSEVAYFSNNQLYVTKIEITDSLKIGNFIFVPRNNGNTSFKKVGEK